MSDDMKQAVCREIDRRKDEIIEIGEDILHHPELGYKEERTSKIVADAFDSLGMIDLIHTGVTGVKGWLNKGKGPAIAVIGELDAVPCPKHPYASKTNQAAHACGHNAQIAAMIGCAMGLKTVAHKLGGSICFLAAPAEEYIEIEERLKMRESGEISYLGGKQQLISEGAFDDIDMAMMVHSETDAPYPRVVTGGPAAGFIGKTVRFIGKEAHAGGAPWDGVNALNAASLAIQAIHSVRETFPDVDCVRVHPIITKGGDAVNTVPSDVRMESYVRAASMEALQMANRKVNRAIEGAAYAVGAQVEIQDIPGYMPLEQDSQLSEFFRQNATQLFPTLKTEFQLPFCGSTDMGDLTFLLPAIQPTVSGFTGAAHSKDFTVSDVELAYLVPAKLMAATVIDLLKEEGSAAKQIISHHPQKTKEEYMQLWADILEKR